MFPHVAELSTKTTPPHFQSPLELRAGLIHSRNLATRTLLLSTPEKEEATLDSPDSVSSQEVTEPNDTKKNADKPPISVFHEKTGVVYKKEKKTA